jgi:hypothetical protein
VLDKLLILSIIKHTQNIRERGDEASVAGGIMGDLKILIILSESKHRNTTNNIIGVKRQHIFVGVFLSCRFISSLLAVMSVCEVNAKEGRKSRKRR